MIKENRGAQYYRVETISVNDVSYDPGSLVLVVAKQQTTMSQVEIIISLAFSRYSASIHRLVYGHVTSNNETVSRKMP